MTHYAVELSMALNIDLEFIWINTTSHRKIKTSGKLLCSMVVKAAFFLVPRAAQRSRR